MGGRGECRGFVIPWKRSVPFESLLEGGAKVEVVDRNGWTPLHTAAAHGRSGVVRVGQHLAPSTVGEFLPRKVLLKYEASKSSKDNEGRTPLDVVCQGQAAVCTERVKTMISVMLSPQVE